MMAERPYVQNGARQPLGSKDWRQPLKVSSWATSLAEHRRTRAQNGAMSTCAN
jgi:hypothetical protein